MVKSLALKAESFNRHCVRTSIVTSSIKEVCFDIQYQFVDFFTITINEIRLAGQTAVFLSYASTL